MRLTTTEEERLLTYAAARFAREALARGLPLSAPEAIAVICDEVHWAARAGGDYADVVAAGQQAVRRDQVLAGVAEVVDEVRVEPLFDEGSRLVVLRWPLGRPAVEPSGVVVDLDDLIPPSPGRRVDLSVVNTSAHVVRVSSHYPFDLVNRRLDFDRRAARGLRLDLPAGSTLAWTPGQHRVVTLVERTDAG